LFTHLFLLYANEWDVAGIIANRPRARDGENRNPERTGLGVVRRLVQAYGQCYSNLVQHDSRYPTPEQLLARTVAGYGDSEEAVQLIVRAVDAPDPRPLWYSDWGSDRGSATNNLKRALDYVLRERGPAGYAKFKQRLRLRVERHGNSCLDRMRSESGKPVSRFSLSPHRMLAGTA
jgi:hypothetical protein